MYYLTLNDLPGGVYYSQVIEVVSYLNSLNKEPVKLIAVIPVRGFWKNRKKIKAWNKESIVLPLPLKLKYWKSTRFYLQFIRGIRKGKVIARGPLACSLAMKISGNVIYDGRAAVVAELEEFPGMVGDIRLADQIKLAEKESVLKSTFQLAVSNQLVKYWREKFGYHKETYAVIPCLVSESNFEINQKIERSSLGIKDDDIVLVFSGGNAGWQSSGLLIDLLSVQLTQENVKVILLAQPTKEFDALKIAFKDKVIQKWVEPDEVNSYLIFSDYGILLRDQIVTNRVASPVKFAEYLSAGLRVLISPNLGDYSDFVVQNDLGQVIVSADCKLTKLTEADRQRTQEIAKAFFLRDKYKSVYLSLLNDHN